MATMDVANNSWGWTSKYADVSSVAGSFGQLFQAALKSSADTGRAGLGTIIVNAARQRLARRDDQRERLPVQRLAPHDHRRRHRRGWRCRRLFEPRLVHLRLGSLERGGRGITTTDKAGVAGYSTTDVTNGFGGTSAASPIVSALAALMLDANDKLGWRDVQDILAVTADHTTPSSLNGGAVGRMAFGWTINKAENVNGGGLHYSNDVGFGQADGFEAVRFAEVWGPLRRGADLRQRAGHERLRDDAQPRARRQPDVRVQANVTRPSISRAPQ